MSQSAIPSLLGIAQPAVTAQQLERARGSLLRFRIMAFATGVVLVAATVVLVLYYGTSINVDTLFSAAWIVHGYLYIVYVISVGLLGLRLRWPLARYALVMLAGTIPTMSFVAEHIVTRATTQAATGRAQSADGRA